MFFDDVDDTEDEEAAEYFFLMIVSGFLFLEATLGAVSPTRLIAKFFL